MSEHTLRWRWEKAIRDDTRPNQTEKLVAFALKSRMNEDGKCWPGLRQLCADTGLSERAIQYAIHGRPSPGERPGLVGFGYLEVRLGGGRRRDGAGIPNGYQACLPNGAQVEEKNGAQAANGAQFDEKGAHGAPLGVHTVHPKQKRKTQQLQEEQDPASDTRKSACRDWLSIGGRRLGDLRAACQLVEAFESGTDSGTLRAFAIDELSAHDSVDFEYTLNKLLDGRDWGVGNPMQPIRSEAAFARRVLQDLEKGYEQLPREYEERRSA